MDPKTVTENGISVSVTENHDNPSKSKIFFNPLMKISREFALTTLAAHQEEHNHYDMIKCLDGFAGTGMAGLQWKRHVGKNTCVTINDMSAEAFGAIQDNCKANGYDAVPEAADRAVNIDGQSPQDGDHSASEADVEVTNKDVNVMMHLRQFHFIYLDPFGSTVQYMDAAFRNVYNKGVVILTCTDIGSLFAKCPTAMLRNYNSHIIRTDYLKELAARIIIGAMARSAARCNKGIEVLYTVAVSHFIQVAVRIKRGATQADHSLDNLHRIAHCQICEEWTPLPNQKSLERDVYHLLPCNCHNTNPGRTAFELGPAWCSRIFNTSFLEKMISCATKLSLSGQVLQLLKLMMEESLCLGHTDQNETLPVVTSKSDNVDKMNGKNDCGDLQASKKRSMEDEGTAAHKRLKGLKACKEEDMPLFFYNLHHRKVKGTDIPKPDKLVDFMRKMGLRASRTHFETQGIRTNATAQQLENLLREYPENSKIKL